MGCEYKVSRRCTRSKHYSQRCGFIRGLFCDERKKFDKSIEKKRKKVLAEAKDMNRRFQEMCREIEI
jgi:hypothetical protein